MTMLSPSPELFDRLDSLMIALDELRLHPDSPVAFLHEATAAHEQAQIAAIVQAGEARIRKAAEVVARRCPSLPAPVMTPFPVCGRCDGRREVVIGIDPSDWTGGTELMGPCPECVAVADDCDLRRFA